MDFEEYQKESRKSVIYPDAGKNLIFPVLGLCGESGEVAEKVKKLFRDSEGKISEERRDEIAKELGDVLWYLAQIAAELGLSLDDIAELNIRKLSDRSDRKVIGGEGDNR